MVQGIHSWSSKRDKEMKEYSVWGRHDTWTGGYAKASPTVGRLNELGYKAELIKVDRPKLAGRYNGSVFTYRTDAPDNIRREAELYRYTPEYFLRWQELKW